MGKGHDGNIMCKHISWKEGGEKEIEEERKEGK